MQPSPGELGITRIPVPVPFAEAGGPANVYAIEEEGGGIALFDSGIGTPVGERALVEGLREIGRSYGDVRRIFLSHGHVDHYGLAQAISEISGAPVFIHERDRDKVQQPEGQYALARDAWREYLARLGVSPDAMRIAETLHLESLRMARPIEQVETLQAGETIRFQRFEVEVHHSPGHTPGLTCLWNAERGLLLSDDHLLERVSPNPLLEIGPEGEANKFRALATYLSTLQTTRALDIALVLPGHGTPFSDARGVIDSLLAFYEKRQRRILDKLAEGPQDAVSLVAHLFPQAKASILFLTLSEVVGNLEVLEDRGLIARRPADPVYRWELAR